jgi:branched-chain amino acid transport system substrate-binding protein
MQERARRVVAALLAMLLPVMLVGCASEASDDSGSAGAEPYRIGAILSLTGTYTSLGEPERNVIEMEVERINGVGGVNGRPTVRCISSHYVAET